MKPQLPMGFPEYPQPEWWALIEELQRDLEEADL